eukprot:jgi/Bigna1/81638/fgenesh1_pg.82_\
MNSQRVHCGVKKTISRRMQRGEKQERMALRLSLDDDQQQLQSLGDVTVSLGDFSTTTRPFLVYNISPNATLKAHCSCLREERKQLSAIHSAPSPCALDREEMYCIVLTLKSAAASGRKRANTLFDHVNNDVVRKENDEKRCVRCAVTRYAALIGKDGRCERTSSYSKKQSMWYPRRGQCFHESLRDIPLCSLCQGPPRTQFQSKIRQDPPWRAQAICCKQKEEICGIVRSHISVKKREIPINWKKMIFFWCKIKKLSKPRATEPPSMAFRRGPAHGLLVSLAAITLASSSDEASPLAKQCEVGSGEGQCERRERCNLERRTGMTPEEFKLEFQDKKPVVMTNVNDNRYHCNFEAAYSICEQRPTLNLLREFARLVTLNALKENFGSNMLCKESIDDADFVEEEDMCTHNILHIRDKNVILSSSNTYRCCTPKCHQERNHHSFYTRMAFISYDKEKMDFGSYLDCVTKNAVKINDVRLSARELLIALSSTSW